MIKRQAEEQIELLLQEFPAVAVLGQIVYALRQQTLTNNYLLLLFLVLNIYPKVRPAVLVVVVVLALLLIFARPSFK